MSVPPDNRQPRSSDPEGVVSTTPSDYLVIGRIARPWGIAGDLKVIPLTDVPGRFRQLRRVFVGGRAWPVRAARAQGALIRLSLVGIETREAAEGLRDQLVEIPRSEAGELPEGQYYHFQIVGLQVIAETGEVLGTVAEVLPTGANDVYLVRGTGRELLLPAIADIVQSIDLDRGIITIRLVEGLVPEEPARRPRPRRSGPPEGPVESAVNPP